MSINSLAIFAFLLVAFFGFLIFNLYQKYQKREIHRCPKCESSNVLELGHETKGSRTVIPSGGGSPSGGDVRLQLDLDLELRCKDCGHGFRKKVTRTY
ncbi:MAG: hypothetical protein AAGD96_11930 [Chloroflexota bacterium]